MTASDYPLLLPQPDPLTQGFWDAAKRHRLALQECARCATLRHPPTRMCAHCGSEVAHWRELSGEGTLYSYVIVHQTALPAWRSRVPYNIVLVAPREAPHLRIHGNVVGLDDAGLKVGLALEAVFDDVTSEDTLIRWRATGAGRDATSGPGSTRG